MPRTSMQTQLNRFWGETLSNDPDPALTAALPDGIFQVTPRTGPSPGVAENVMAGYDRTVEACRAKVDRIVQECRLTNQKYQDPDFDLRQPWVCLDSLIQKPENELQPLSCKRVREIFDKPEFFVDGATADDVRQGELGDCWFLSSLSALCNIEDNHAHNLVEHICVHRDEKIGVYGFVFFRDGEWREEIIDDKLYLTNKDYEELNDTETNTVQKYLTKDKGRAETYRKIVQTNSDSLFFASSAHRNETWVPLIEKAYAKAHGDYQSLDSGFPGEGIEDLTGGLHTYFKSADIADQDRFWKDGLALVNKTFLWSCETRRVNGKDSRGMIEHHAYAILAAETIGDGTRLLKVRNPWGQSEWEGDWSDRSKKWTNEVKSQLIHQYDDDGIFWISYEDLLRICPTMSRTRIFGKDWTVAQFWTRMTVPLLATDDYDKVFGFSLATDCKTVIALSQLDHRYYKGLNGQYTFNLFFRLHRAGDDDYLHRCQHRRTTDRCINLEVDLKAGQYELYVKVVTRRNRDLAPPSEVIQHLWDIPERRQKLLLTCKNHDIAHAKVPPAPASEADDSGSDDFQTDDGRSNHESDNGEDGQSDYDDVPDHSRTENEQSNDEEAEEIAEGVEEPSEDLTTYQSAEENCGPDTDSSLPNTTKAEPAKPDTDSSSNDVVVVAPPSPRPSTPNPIKPQPSKTSAPVSPRSIHSQAPNPKKPTKPTPKTRTKTQRPHPRPHDRRDPRRMHPPPPRPRPRYYENDLDYDDIRPPPPPFIRPHPHPRPHPPHPHPIPHIHPHPHPHPRPHPFPHPFPHPRPRPHPDLHPHPHPHPLPPPLDRRSIHNLDLDNPSRPVSPLSPNPSEPLPRDRLGLPDMKPGHRPLSSRENMREPSSTTCIVGLRVYCQGGGGEARIWRVGAEGKEEREVEGEEKKEKHEKEGEGEDKSNMDDGVKGKEPEKDQMMQKGEKEEEAGLPKESAGVGL